MPTVARSRRAAQVAALLLLAALGGGCAPPDGTPPPHGFVLVVVDTLRADRLSAYGHDRTTSPHIDRLAREGVLFEDAVSHASWTLPGFVGLLSGRHPSSRVFAVRLRRSLVGRFRAAGYTSAAFTEGAYVSAEFGLDEGFEAWRELPGLPQDRDSQGEYGVARTFAAARRWLRAHGSRPFFLMIHTYEVHLPYERPRFARELPSGALEPGSYGVPDANRVQRGKVRVGDTERAYVRALYDGGVAMADRHIGALLDELRALGLEGRTVVAVTSDHGELLGAREPKHLGSHGRNLYEALLHVPLLIRDPRREYPRSRVTRQVRLLDVMPTLLDLAGLEPGASLDGRSLVPLMEGADVEPSLAYAELLERGTNRLRRAAVRLAGWKLILNAPGTGDPALELYELTRDPGERRNLVETRSAERARLYGLLVEERSRRAREGRAPMGGEEGLDPSLRDRLRALGYVP